MARCAACKRRHERTALRHGERDPARPVEPEKPTAPEVLDLARETKDTQALYGIGERATDNFGRQCLLARRLCEAGVRYLQVCYRNISQTRNAIPPPSDAMRSMERAEMVSAWSKNHFRPWSGMS